MVRKIRKAFCIRIQGESASVDHEATRVYLEKFQNIIEEQRYIADQVFNADEIKLWWKKRPNRIFISKKEKTEFGIKVSKDCITLLLYSNTQK